MTGWLSSLLQQVVEFAGSSPTTVGLILAFAAGAEAVIIVGALFPGEAMVLAVAAAAGVAGLDLIPLVLWTSAGAIIGDGISFWIGHRNGEAIANWKYLKQRPALLSSGEKFIEKHGYKSILIARFLPGLRAIVPVAAGVLKMPPVQFYVANVISAVLWALTHVLPAAGLGVAFNTLGAVSGRLTMLVGLLLITVFLLVWLIRITISFTGPPLVALYGRLVERLGSQRWRGAARLAELLNPEHPHLPGMAFWAAFLLLMTMAFIKVLEDLITGDPLVKADIAINQLMQNLRSEPVDNIMLVITSMADAPPMIAAGLALIALLVVQRAYTFAAWAGVTIMAAVAFVPAIKLVLHKPRPIEMLAGADAYSFPSGHTTISVVLFSVLAVLVARKLRLGVRLSIYTLVVLWICAVGLSRIYLSAHWPSDVLGGLFFGAALTAVFAMLVNHLDSQSYSRVGLAAGVLAVFLGAGVVHTKQAFDDNAALYASRVPVAHKTIDSWRHKGWQEFPSTRVDIRGVEKEPFAIQWVGPEAKLKEWLAANGWRQAGTFGWRDALEFLLPHVKFDEFAPLPRLHNGAQPVATFIYQQPEAAGLPADERLVLRFWATNTVVMRQRNGERGHRVLLGALRRERLLHPFGMSSVLQPVPAEISDMQLLGKALDNASGLSVERMPDAQVALVTPNGG